MVINGKASVMVKPLSKFRTRLLDRRVVTEENVTGLNDALAHIYRLYASAESSSAYGNLLV